MQRNICLKADGSISLTPAAGDLFDIEYDLYDHLGSDAVLDVKLSMLLGATSPTADKTLVSLVWRDATTDDVIFAVDGVVGTDEENINSLISRADATQAFKSFDVTFTGAGFAAAVELSDAYNPANGLGRNKIEIALSDDQPAAFNGDAVFDALTTMMPKPSYLALPFLDNLPVYTVALRAAQNLNIPLDCEADPMLTVDQVAALATSLDAQDHRVQIIWNPCLSRPRDAVTLNGRKKPQAAVGQLLAFKLLRNARSQNGIPPIHIPCAGPDFPFTFKQMTLRTDIVLNAANLEKLAVAKVNVVRPIAYDTGERFVLSDGLTQYNSADSALRLVNSAEIACYTLNRCIEISKRHMLKNQEASISDANRDIGLFLEQCSSPSSKLLVPAQDLGGRPYRFSIEVDSVKPFERWKLKLERRPEGMTRGVIIDDVLVK